jgi:hypothetical protein
MVNLLGYAASCTVLATFLMRTMVPLRLVAILSNVLFLLFGYIEHIYPVFFLHVALLPINTWRLVAVQKNPAAPAAVAPPVIRPLHSRPRYAFWFAVGLLAGLVSTFAVLIVAHAHVF